MGTSRVVSDLNCVAAHLRVRVPASWGTRVGSRPGMDMMRSRACIAGTLLLALLAGQCRATANIPPGEAFAQFGPQLRPLFAMEKNLTNLNHGSYG